ncbi:MAG: hypothetical protein ACTSP4_05285 [Candidatus Hodarchaeales archaeon]
MSPLSNDIRQLVSIQVLISPSLNSIDLDSFFKENSLKISYNEQHKDFFRSYAIEINHLVRIRLDYQPREYLRSSLILGKKGVLFLVTDHQEFFDLADELITTVKDVDEYKLARFFPTQWAIWSKRGMIRGINFTKYNKSNIAPKISLLENSKPLLDEVISWVNIKLLIKLPGVYDT